jgi:hypothetical protein
MISLTLSNPSPPFFLINSTVLGSWKILVYLIFYVLILSIPKLLHMDLSPPTCLASKAFLPAHTAPLSENSTLNENHTTQAWPIRATAMESGLDIWPGLVDEHQLGFLLKLLEKRLLPIGVTRRMGLVGKPGLRMKPTLREACLSTWICLYLKPMLSQITAVYSPSSFFLANAIILGSVSCNQDIPNYNSFEL